MIFLKFPTILCRRTVDLGVRPKSLYRESAHLNSISDVLVQTRYLHRQV